MMLRRKQRGVAVFKCLSVLVLLLTVFGLVWLRSSVVSLEYSLCQLERKKVELAKDKKLLAAEKARLVSAARLSAAADAELVFPDRVNVVSVLRSREAGAYKVSYPADKKIARPETAVTWRN